MIDANSLNDERAVEEFMDEALNLHDDLLTHGSLLSGQATSPKTY
jgi:hypothetical protein